MGAEYYTDLEGFALSRWQASTGKHQDQSGTPKAENLANPELSADQRKTLQQLEQEGDLRIHPRLT